MTPETCTCDEEYFEVDEPTFRWMLNGKCEWNACWWVEDAMATDLLSDGIRRFAADTEKLEAILMEKL